MIWDYFIYFAIASVVLWLAGALAAWKGRMVPALAATSIGSVCLLGLHPCDVGHIGTPSHAHHG